MTVTKPEFKKRHFLSKMPSRMERSLRHVAMVARFLNLNNLGPVNMAEKKNEKVVMYDFPVQWVAHSFFHRSTMQMAVSVKKDC